jgi:hypothetical protein
MVTSMTSFKRFVLGFSPSRAAFVLIAIGMSACQPTPACLLEDPPYQHYAYLTVAECRAEQDRLRAEKAAQEQKAQQEADQQAAAFEAQRAAAKKEYDDAVAKNIRWEKEHGYEPMSFEDFQLDGKDLAAKQATVAIEGQYIKDGNIE